MKFNELSDMMQKPEPKPDTYEAGMALNQLLKIGTHAIKIHNMICLLYTSPSPRD